MLEGERGRDGGREERKEGRRGEREERKEGRRGEGEGGRGKGGEERAEIPH